MRSATAASISHNDIFSNGSTGLTTTGLVFAGAGKSHSFETPTSRSPRPRAKAISVADGKNEMSRSSVIHKTLEKILEVAPYNIYINSCSIWEFWYELVSFGLDKGPRMSGRLRTRIRLFIRKSLESGVVIAGGERLFDFPSLQGGKFWSARPAEARARKRLGLTEIIGLTPRLQTENEA